MAEVFRFKLTCDVSFNWQMKIRFGNICISTILNLSD